MKRYSLFFWIITACFCVIGFAGCASEYSEFIQITEEDLCAYLQGNEDVIIFCTQELCKGCEIVKEYLQEIAVENNTTVYSFEVETQSSKELLFQYGLNQVPAIIKTSSGQVEIYKGLLSKENIVRLLSTENIEYDRINNITEISYDDFLQKENSNKDFFAYFSRQDCSDCQIFYKVLSQYVLNNPGSGAYIVDINTVKDSLSETEYERFLDAYSIQWVPYVLHMKNGVRLSSYEYPELEFRANDNYANPSSEAALAFYSWMDNELK